jgi:hypothetical protein
MTTVIGSLVVELAIDARQLNEGTRQALENFKRTQEEAKKGGGQVEAEGKRVINYLDSLKRAALGVTGILLGGMGLKEFTGYLTNLDAATARVAKTMDVSVRELSAWQGAAEQTGGSAEGMTGTLQNLSSEVNKFVLTGQSGLLAVLTPLGIGLYNTNGQLKTSTELFLELADAVQGMDPARARAMLSMLGMDQSAINLAIQGRHAIEGYLDAAKAAGLTTAQSAEDAAEYQRQLALLNLTATNTGRTLLTTFAPALDIALVTLRHLADGNIWGAIGHGFAAPFKQFVAVIDDMNAKLYDAAALVADFFGNKDKAAEDRAKASEARQSAQSWRTGAEQSRQASLADQGLVGHLAAGQTAPLETLEATMGSRGDRNNNPGNIKMGPVARKFGAVSQDDQGHAIFPTWQAGNAAQAELLRRSYSGLTLAEIGQKYAEDPNWASGVAQYSGFSLSQVPDLSDPATMGRLQAAIRRQEGTHAPAGFPTGSLGMPIGAPAAATLQHSSMIDNSRGNTTHMVKVETGDIHVSAPNARTNGDIGEAIGASLQRQAALASWNTGLV